MQKRALVSMLAVASSAVLVTGLVSCGGTSGGKEDFSGTQYVADSSAGSISFGVMPTSIQVSRTSGFSVVVKNGSGSPVPSIQISCDTERGLALVEPTSGKEITDSGGAISGTVGCETPGSYQIGCRLPVGGNKRVFATIKCTGEIPDGFAGFPGAGGGGLGGGAQNPGTSVEGFGITSRTLIDGEEEGGTSVDTTQLNNCGTDGTDSEPFGDAYITYDFVNETNSEVTCDTYTFTVPGVGTFGPIALGVAITGGVAPNGGEASVNVPLATAEGDGTKSWAGSSTAVSASTGFKNVEFEFNCIKDTGDAADEGDDFTVSDTVAINFSNLNRCAEGGGGSGGGGGSLSGVSLSFRESGVAVTSSDVVDTTCGAGESESIVDLSFVMTINNNTGGTVSVTSYTVEVEGVGTAATQNKSAQLANGDNQTFTGIAALGTGTAKTTLGATSIGNIGLTTITVTVNGTDADGNSVSVTASDSVNFTEVDNCS